MTAGLGDLSRRGFDDQAALVEIGCRLVFGFVADPQIRQGGEQTDGDRRREQEQPLSEQELELRRKQLEAIGYVN